MYADCTSILAFPPLCHTSRATVSLQGNPWTDRHAGEGRYPEEWELGWVILVLTLCFARLSNLRKRLLRRGRRSERGLS